MYMKKQVSRGGGEVRHRLSFAKEAPEIMHYKYYAKNSLRSVLISKFKIMAIM